MKTNLIYARIFEILKTENIRSSEYKGEYDNEDSLPDWPSVKVQFISRLPLSREPNVHFAKDEWQFYLWIADTYNAYDLLDKVYEIFNGTDIRISIPVEDSEPFKKNYRCRIIDCVPFAYEKEGRIHRIKAAIN